VVGVFYGRTLWVAGQHIFGRVWKLCIDIGLYHLRCSDSICRVVVDNVVGHTSAGQRWEALRPSVGAQEYMHATQRASA